MQGDLRELTNTIFMIRPHLFRSNQMTIADNFYQAKNVEEQNLKINQQALKEFDLLVDQLKTNGVNVVIVQDSGKYDTPDSIFPNNWISFHQDSGYILYPMYAKNRRDQRKIDIFQQLTKSKIHFKMLRDYTKFEEGNIYLEGTGSLVLDRKYKIAYAALSQRTNQNLVLKFCEDNNYQPCIFRAYQTVNKERCPIYHTNVMMWIGKDICGICFQSIDDLAQREKVRTLLNDSKRQILQLTEHQICEFAGNAIMLQGKKNGQNLLVMSVRALNSLSLNQIKMFAKEKLKIIHSDVSTIQKYGGGGARCMIAEIF